MADTKPITLKEHLVHIGRGSDGKNGMGMHKVASRVWEHELPVLAMIHKPENVQSVKSEDVKVHEFDVMDEYLRMKRKYNRGDDHKDVVEKVYGQGPHVLAQRLGITKVSETGSKGVNQSVQVDYREGPRERNAPTVNTPLPPPPVAAIVSQF